MEVPDADGRASRDQQRLAVGIPAERTGQGRVVADLRRGTNRAVGLDTRADLDDVGG
jgi:hypothetical protein